MTHPFPAGHEDPGRSLGGVAPECLSGSEMGQSSSPTPILDPGSRWATVRSWLDGNYFRVKVPAQWRPHPVQDKDAKAYLHRVVLADEIGPGPHACNWCGWDGLSWEVTDPKDPQFLAADHLNAVTADCRVKNLAPSCRWCNDNRSVVEVLGIDWTLFTRIPPNKRPGLKNLRTKKPTKVAHEIARGGAATPPGRDVVGEGSSGSQRSPSPAPNTPIREGLVSWEELVG